ncbi:ATP-binding protein [Streptomyces sp. NPDC013178]|uniref:ATP-binding protein n=1 Tax=unclassified Streptomyces TaxID=2593676 RepID=UPI0033F7D5CF
MSLPLSRRIARAALLVAAGAAAGVGAAGSASAAPALPTTPDLGGVTAADGTNVGDTVDTVKQAVPTVDKTGDKAVKQTAGAAGGVLRDAESTAKKNGVSTDSLTKTGKTLPLG